MSLFGTLFTKSAPPVAPPSPTPLRGYQIVYDAATREQRDPDFEALDNGACARPDWFEYWPIRNYLTTTVLDESTIYGFVSPQFQEKTRLTGRKVRQFIAASADADVYTFSPFPCHGATFLNVFEQADFFTPGFLQVATEFFESIGESVRLDELVNHCGTVVFCNYFFAKPKFWRDWLRLCEQLRTATDASSLSASLNQEMQYTKENGASKIVQNKVFLLERLASYLLARGGYSVVNFPPLLMPVANTHVNLTLEIHLLDELKRRHLQTGSRALLEQYRQMQRHVIGVAWPGRIWPHAPGD